MEDLPSNLKRKHPQGDRILDDLNRKHQKYDTHVNPNTVSTSRDGNSISFQRKSNLSPSGKVAKLLSALDDVLSAESEADSRSLIGDGALQKCLDLQTTIRTHSSQIIDAPPTKPDLSKINTPKSMSAVLITPWIASEIPEEMPELPEILDSTLKEACFRHSSTGTGKLSDLNYEQLEWVGDIYLELTATLLISQTFPSLGPGKASQMRERMVRNLQLSDYSLYYGFDKRIQLGPQISLSDRDKRIKILGDVFEAYVAAIILSDPENGISIATNWLKGLWGMTLRREIAHEEQHGIKFESPMWKLVGDAREALLQTVVVNPKDQLRKMIGAKGVSISYRDVAPPKRDRNSKLQIYTVGVFLDGWGEKDKQMGYGSALGKKEAGTKAAEMALNNKKLMAPLQEKKKIYDDQMALEQEALDKAQGL